MKTQLRASFIKNKSTKEEDSSYREFWDKIQTTVSFWFLFVAIKYLVKYIKVMLGPKVEQMFSL